jgi:hypothetical protein
MTNEGLSQEPQAVHAEPEEGVLHGPFAPPEIAGGTTDWIMREAEGDPVLYQLYMHRDSLIDDAHPGPGEKAKISPAFFRENMNRIAGAVNNQQARKAAAVGLPMARQARVQGSKRSLDRRRSAAGN